jgi:hypothetical protein
VIVAETVLDPATAPFAVALHHLRHQPPEVLFLGEFGTIKTTTGSIMNLLDTPFKQTYNCGAQYTRANQGNIFIEYVGPTGVGSIGYLNSMVVIPALCIKKLEFPSG